VLFAQSVFTYSIPWYIYLLNGLVLLLSIMLILLVLIQRGKGGGLAGAFGGVGGSSAFGSRAGDTFTKITIGFAAAWILLTMIQVVVIQNEAAKRAPSDTPAVVVEE
jgi:preprotein translocase subunit SecG